MRKYTYPVECPLMKDKKIDINTCFEIHMVVQGDAPTRIAPKEIFENGNYFVLIMNNKKLC